MISIHFKLLRSLSRKVYLNDTYVGFKALIEVYFCIYKKTFGPGSDKRDLMAIKVKSGIFREKERTSYREQLLKFWRDYLYK